jgi:hypothetical protein
MPNMLNRREKSPVGRYMPNNSGERKGSTGQVKHLGEVKNPSYLISFKFTDKRVKELSEITNFKNLVSV